ncbi:cell envelope biogenesis protein OmpA [Aurantibacter sp.]|uniref:cell envelope biogenesis protein OmpA n=1 Tax=Aurantibacter sp. TaxID=2807103 RepID=UPI0035C7AB94
MRLQNHFKCFAIIFLLSLTTLFAQEDYSVLKGQIAFGINSPAQDGFVRPFEAKGTNFPTINFGVQYMFKAQFGAKLDLGYNRMANGSDSPEFKLNYTRVNAQLVYDLTTKTTFLPQGTGFVLHAGPGFSMIKPLGDYGANKTSFLNAMAGFEFHYKVARTTSVYLDTSYVFAFGSEFDPITEGYGSFNGNMLTVTLGLSVSLSGCRTCN